MKQIAAPIKKNQFLPYATIARTTKPAAKGEWIWVTPITAQEWLTNSNVDNRRVRTSHVEYLKGLLLRGEYKFTHQGIAFTKSDRLVDGQHRLMAIVAADVSTWLFVMTGLDEDVFEAIDGGVKRTMEDQTTISRDITDACTWVVEMMGEAASGTNRVAPAQVLKYARLLGPHIDDLNKFCGRARRKVLTSAAATATAAIRILAHPNQRTLVLGGMDALRNAKFAEMNAIQHAFFKATNDGYVSARDRSDVAVRVWFALDPARASLSKVQVKDPEHTLAAMRTVLIQALGVQS